MVVVVGCCFVVVVVFFVLTVIVGCCFVGCCFVVVVVVDVGINCYNNQKGLLVFVLLLSHRLFVVVSFLIPS